MTEYPSIREMRRHVDDTLNSFLADRVREIPEGPERALIDEVARVVRSGGKRLRPSFCYWGYRTAGGADVKSIIRLAASLELLHTFAIVHDDVMDSSALRRGEPTVHRRFADDDRPMRVDPERFGESAAILVGDLAFVLADELFHSAGLEGAPMRAALGWYTDMRREVIRGQFLDLLAASTGAASGDDALRIALLKSGGYTVEKPLLIGASAAGGGEELLGVLSAYGVPLGKAFQLRDDVLGVFGDPARTGKDADGDILEGKQTYLIAIARERADARDRTFLDSRLGRRDVTAEDVDRLRGILTGTGALAETTRLIDSLAHEAVVVARSIGGRSGAALEELAREATARET
jgi:geranylgeranyl diphosphate synthase type I